MADNTNSNTETDWTRSTAVNSRITRSIGTALLGFLALGSQILVFGQITTTDEVKVEADRLPQADTAAPFDVHVLESDDLRNAPQLRLDDILRETVPGFSLFRRNSSLTANPTTQGVTLRNFGPSGAGRTLVLFDGIPLNDPFAGYVLWSQIPSAAVHSVLVVSGGGSGLFGNQALAGTIFLVSQPIDQEHDFAETEIGNYSTYDADIQANVGRDPVHIAIFSEYFSTSGYSVIRGDQRGPVDNTASADSGLYD